MIRVMVRYCDVLALTHTGKLDLADKRAAEYANFSSAGQFLAWAIAKITIGLVATYRGNFPEAISSIEQALAALSAEAPLPWQLPGRLLLARAYAALGATGRRRTSADRRRGTHRAVHGVARTAADDMPRRGSRPPRAWSAARSNWPCSPPTRRTRQGSTPSRPRHCTTRPGSATAPSRIGLRHLRIRSRADVVSLQARHAAAVAAADPAALDTSSAEFEEAGFLLSAADSAARGGPAVRQRW